MGRKKEKIERKKEKGMERNEERPDTKVSWGGRHPGSADKGNALARW